MNPKIRTVGYRVAVSVVMLAQCCVQSETTPETTIETTPSGVVTSPLTTLNGTTDLNMTAAANTTGNATTEIFTTTVSTEFDYSDLNWTRRINPSDETTGFRESTTEDIYSSNVSQRIPPGDDSVTVMDSNSVMVAAITAGSVIVLFALCYVGNMMNLCICRFFMYECPTGRYREDAKEVDAKPKP